VVRLRTVDRWRLLTGMLVIPAFRGQGTGHALLSHCRSRLLGEGDYCFAYSHLESFYQQHGFVTIEKTALPGTLLPLFERYSRSGKSLIPMKFEV
jgi:predicted N-acetyltransferase YhbS